MILAGEGLVLGLEAKCKKILCRCRFIPELCDAMPDLSRCVVFLGREGGGCDASSPPPIVLVLGSWL